MSEFVDFVFYRKDGEQWDSMFINDEEGIPTKLGMWVPTDDVNKRVLRVQRDEINNL